MKVDKADLRVAYPLFYDGENKAIELISPKQLEIRETNMRRAALLNYHWHSILPDTFYGNLVRSTHSIAYEAVYMEIAYAVAIWTTPIAANRLKDGFKLLELRRLAISEDAPRNTASRMLSMMRKDIKRRFSDIIRLISYQSIDHHHGTIYKASNWRPAANNEYSPWDNSRRKRGKSQITSDKVRWEIDL